MYLIVLSVYSLMITTDQHNWKYQAHCFDGYCLLVYIQIRFLGFVTTFSGELAAIADNEQTLHAP